MNQSDALQVISESRARGTCSPFPNVEDREHEIDKVFEDLKQRLITPVQVVVVSAVYDQYDFQTFSESIVYAIAGIEDTYLLYAPAHGLFALGWGESFEQICMLGFASNDAIAEWRG